MTKRIPYLTGAVAMLAAVLLPDPTLGQARRFEAFGESNLEVNGETDPSAELFSDPSDHALLVLSRRLRSAFALTVEDAGL